MNQRLEVIRSFRPRSALDEFLERTVVYEAAGARMPGVLVFWALLGAVITAGLGVLGIVVAEGSTAGFIGFINGVSWLAIGLGALLVITAICLSRARSIDSRKLMQRQLVAGAVVPGIALALIAVYLAIAALVLWFMFMMVWVLIDP